MYQGTLFKLGWKYAYLIGADVRIISAKYGLLNPDDLIVPYDEKMTKSRAKVIFAAYAKEIRELSEYGKYAAIYVLCGDAYKSVFDSVWDDHFQSFSDLLWGEPVKGIGDMIKGLNTMIEDKLRDRGITDWEKE